MDRKVCRAPPPSRERLVFLAKRSLTLGEIAPAPALGPKTASVLRYGTWGGTHEKQCKLLLKLYLKLYKGNTNTHRKAPKPHQRSALISMLKNKESSTCTRPLFASSWAAGTWNNGPPEPNLRCPPHLMAYPIEYQEHLHGRHGATQ